ncbi:flagellar hook-length control protein FliK [Falsiruegeria litorea]|nr:flagellar hook-length control protein FliK [Falsiruegeria litorea]
MQTPEGEAHVLDNQVPPNIGAPSSDSHDAIAQTHAKTPSEMPPDDVSLAVARVTESRVEFSAEEDVTRPENVETAEYALGSHTHLNRHQEPGGTALFSHNAGPTESVAFPVASQHSQAVYSNDRKQIPNKTGSVTVGAQDVATMQDASRLAEGMSPVDLSANVLETSVLSRAALGPEASNTIPEATGVDPTHPHSLSRQVTGPATDQGNLLEFSKRSAEKSPDEAKNDLSTHSSQTLRQPTTLGAGHLTSAWAFPHSTPPPLSEVSKSVIAAEFDASEVQKMANGLPFSLQGEAEEDAGLRVRQNWPTETSAVQHPSPKPQLNLSPTFTGAHQGAIVQSISDNLQLSSGEDFSAMLSSLPLEDALGLAGTSAATPQTVTAPADVLRPDIARSIGGQLAAQANARSQGTVDIALNPEELGRVRMAIAAGESTVAISIVAERPETLELMRRHADLLIEEFRNLGYGDIEFEFSDGSSASGDSAGHAPNDDSHANKGIEPEMSAPSTSPPNRPVQQSGLDMRL